MDGISPPKLEGIAKILEGIAEKWKELPKNGRNCQKKNGRHCPYLEGTAKKWGEFPDSQQLKLRFQAGIEPSQLRSRSSRYSRWRWSGIASSQGN